MFCQLQGYFLIKSWNYLSNSLPSTQELENEFQDFQQIYFQHLSTKILLLFERHKPPKIKVYLKLKKYLSFTHKYLRTFNPLSLHSAPKIIMPAFKDWFLLKWYRRGIGLIPRDFWIWDQWYLPWHCENYLCLLQIINEFCIF